MGDAMTFTVVLWTLVALIVIFGALSFLQYMI